MVSTYLHFKTDVQKCFVCVWDCLTAVTHHCMFHTHTFAIDHMLNDYIEHFHLSRQWRWQKEKQQNTFGLFLIKFVTCGFFIICFHTCFIITINISASVQTGILLVIVNELTKNSKSHNQMVTTINSLSIKMSYG